MSEKMPNFAVVTRFCEGSYDVACGDCERQLCTDQPFNMADRLATEHNDVFHKARIEAVAS